MVGTLSTMIPQLRAKWYGIFTISFPPLAKFPAVMYNKGRIRRYDGIGRRDGLKIRWWRHRVGSSPTTGTSSSQASYRLRRAFSFHCKAHRALILLLLASKPQPLRWVAVWGRRCAAVLSVVERISILTAPVSSSQATQRLRRAFSFIWRRKPPEAAAFCAGILAIPAGFLYNIVDWTFARSGGAGTSIRKA